VIKREDHATKKKSALRANRGISAFSRYTATDQGTMGREQAVACRGQDEEADEVRRWRRTLRAVFSEEAAAAMLTELSLQYQTEDFQVACRRLNESWGPGTDYLRQMQDIDELCLRRVLGPMLCRYGFSADQKGNQEVNNIIADLSTHSSEVYEKKMQVQRQIFSYFTNLGKWT